MIKQISTVLGWLAVFVTSGYGSYRLGNKLGGAIARRYLGGPTITEIAVWNGPIPEYQPSK